MAPNQMHLNLCKTSHPTTDARAHPKDSKKILQCNTACHQFAIPSLVGHAMPPLSEFVMDLTAAPHMQAPSSY